MSLTDELLKLEQLRQNGTLTDDEFSKAKALLLTAPSPASNVDVGAVVENQLTHLRHLNELERIDREWQIERQQYEVVGRYGRKFVPSLGEGVSIAVVGGLLGLLWTVMAGYSATMMSSGPMAGLGLIMSSSFTVIGLIILLGSIIKGHSAFIVAQNYQTAYRAYQRRRRQAVQSTESHSDFSFSPRLCTSASPISLAGPTECVNDIASTWVAGETQGHRDHGDGDPAHRTDEKRHRTD